MEIGINRPCIDDLICQAVHLFFMVQIVTAQLYLYAIQHIFDHLRVAAYRNPLIKRIEIVVVEGQPYRQPLDDKGGQFPAGPPPLLFRVSLDQLFIYIYPSPLGKSPVPPDF